MDHDRTENALAFERVVFFSDAVFAIAITLLVLEIRVPHAEPGGVLAAVLRLLPKIVCFAGTFVVIGSVWIEHHRIFSYIARADGGLLWRNLIFLLLVAFMPFPTALFNENYDDGSALAIYAGSLALVGLAKLWVWRYASAGARLLAPSVPSAVVRRVSRRSWAVPLTCGGVAVLGALGLPWAYVFFGFIPLVARLLDRPSTDASPATADAAPAPAAAAPAPAPVPAPARTIDKVSVAGKLALFHETWSPKVIAAVNDTHVKLVRLQGEFVWHAHEAEDELFHVLKGRLRMQFREREVVLEPGELIVVPRGVEHRPVADGEVQVMLLEPASTVNTGTAGGERTRAAEWI